MTPGLRGHRAASGRAGFASTAGLPGSKEFFDLLRRRRRSNADETDGRVESRCTRELAILMSDSSGFSRKTHEYGILQFLAVMTQCYDRLIPVIERHRGICLSHNADNLVAIFAESKDAVKAAAAMHRWLRKRNEGLSEAEQFNICIGINWGKVLRLKDNIYGDRVNVAAKVGEDLAGKDEILVTKEVAARVSGLFRCEYLRSTEIGGRTFELHRVAY